MHLGIAVNLDQGLVVPVIRDADELTMAELSARAKQLADKARAGSLAPDEMSGSTFTISNMGMLDVENFTAIINPGESAILAVSSTIKKPVVRGDEIVARPMMKMTLRPTIALSTARRRPASSTHQEQARGQRIMERFDVVVIGAGPGGYPAAIRAAQLGASVAIVEKERLGGTCLNWGCIPTKALIAAAETFAHVSDAAAFGISVSGATFDYAAMIRRKDKVVGQLRGGVKQLLTANGVKQFAGTAAFKDRETIAIDGAAAIGAKRTIIATGSTSAMPGFLPTHERIVESRAFLALDRLPASMIVLGGGFIGCELACMAAMLGVKVTIVELLEDILMLLDADVRREVRAHMEKALGIRVLTGKALEDISADANGVRGRFGDETLRADLLLSAVGRKPVTDGLNLANAGLETERAASSRPTTIAGPRRRPSSPSATSPAKPSSPITPPRKASPRRRTPSGAKPRRHETLVPNVIFTSPEVGTVGLSEADAARAEARRSRPASSASPASARASPPARRPAS